MAFWKETFLTKIRKEWLRRIVKMQYYADGVWYDATITSKGVNGTAITLTTQTTDSAALNITKVRLLDVDGDVAGEITENIVKSATQGVVTLWEFPLYEVVK